MGNSFKGIIAILAASSIWGLSSLFYKALAHVPPLEVLSHRTLWSLVFFGVVLMVRGRLGAVFQALKNWRVVLGLALAALMISLNWGGFITSIQFGYALEASLGYYFFPLVVVGLGALIYGEKFTRFQGVALALMGLAVLVLTFGLGAPPWIALFLAGTFGVYALIKKRIQAGPMSPFLSRFCCWLQLPLSGSMAHTPTVGHLCLAPPVGLGKTGKTLCCSY